MQPMYTHCNTPSVKQYMNFCDNVNTTLVVDAMVTRKLLRG